MPTNNFFNNYKSSMEQSLIEDLVVESIKIYGIDVHYLPKRNDNIDSVFRDEELITFDSAYMIEAYIKNVDGMQGDGDFLSKFGLEIRDQITFTISRRSFQSEIIINEPLYKRPKEGDLIWFPLTSKLYKVKFVEHESVFYQLGGLQTYDISCDLFEYNNEIFNTGLPEIDNVYQPLDADIGTSAPEDVILADVQSQNEEFDTQKSVILNFSETHPWGEP